MQAVLIEVDCLDLGEKWYMWIITLWDTDLSSENQILKRM